MVVSDIRDFLLPALLLMLFLLAIPPSFGSSSTLLPIRQPIDCERDHENPLLTIPWMMLSRLLYRFLSPCLNCLAPDDRLSLSPLSCPRYSRIAIT